MPSIPHRVSNAASGHSEFATTHWSAVLAAGRLDSPEAHAALAGLCQAYWYPLYAFVRRRGFDADEAQDLTQEFFARLLEKNYLQTADRQRSEEHTSELQSPY